MRMKMQNETIAIVGPQELRKRADGRYSVAAVLSNSQRVVLADTSFSGYFGDFEIKDFKIESSLVVKLPADLVYDVSAYTTSKGETLLYILCGVSFAFLEVFHG